MALGDARRTPLKLGTWAAQGGFAGEGVVPREDQLEKFAGLTTCPSFNLNGDPKTVLRALKEPGIGLRRFVSKNVCHGVIYDHAMHEQFGAARERRKSIELIWKGMDHYLRSTAAGRRSTIHSRRAARSIRDRPVGRDRRLSPARRVGLAAHTRQPDVSSSSTTTRSSSSRHCSASRRVIRHCVRKRAGYRPRRNRLQGSLIEARLFQGRTSDGCETNQRRGEAASCCTGANRGGGGRPERADPHGLADPASRAARRAVDRAGAAPAPGGLPGRRRRHGEASRCEATARRHPRAAEEVHGPDHADVRPDDLVAQSGRGGLPTGRLRVDHDIGAQALGVRKLAVIDVDRANLQPHGLGVLDRQDGRGRRRRRWRSTRPVSPPSP